MAEKSDGENGRVVPWRCANDHILGMVKRGGKKSLLLYRHALDMNVDAPAEVEVLGRLQGSMLEIKCDVCGAVRTWMEDEPKGRKVDTYVAE